MTIFEAMIGRDITALIPMFNSPDQQNRLKKFKLHGVEAGGLWLEDPETSNSIFQRAGSHASPKAVVVFVPFDKISYVISYVDSQSLPDQKTPA